MVNKCTECGNKAPIRINKAIVVLNDGKTIVEFPECNGKDYCLNHYSKTPYAEKIQNLIDEANGVKK